MNRQNRPGNRQPRPPKDTRNARPTQTSVPNISQVLPGATVSIVLKEDQPTGNEIRGVVQYVLTKGNHPRGIKVRLRDGQVGRVQRMIDAGGNSTSQPTPTAQPSSTAQTTTSTASTTRFTNRYTDIRNEDELEGPPPRSLADFFPAELDTREPEREEEQAEDVAAPAKCPICDVFEGDEVAVSYHVEREHLMG